jgi:hypothetical protein
MVAFGTVADKPYKVLVPNLANGFHFDAELSLGLAPIKTIGRSVNMQNQM